MSRPECERCDGCGQIADSDEGEPWTAWTSLPPGSDLAVRMGLVKPIPCPDCTGPATEPAVLLDYNDLDVTPATDGETYQDPRDRTWHSGPTKPRIFEDGAILIEKPLEKEAGPPETWIPGEPDDGSES